jgi:hypothetical protein
MMMSKISINYWGSHPDLDNDDCFGGNEFDSIADAIQFYMEDPSDSSVEYIEIDLSDDVLKMYNIERMRKNPNFIPPNRDDDWKREIAMQAGMEMGVEAYNDYMGYDSEEYHCD